MAKGVNIPLKIQGLREAREDLAKLNEEFEKVKDDPIKSKKIAKEFNELSKAIDKTADELKEAQAAGELLGVKFDDLNEVIAGTTTEVLPLTSQIGEMEDRMYQLAAAGDTSSKEFKALQGETVRLRKVIIETDRSIDTMAENAGSIGGITSAFGELGESVLSLDFKRAGVALKGLGAQFKAFGRVLLANPIFLIVAVVAAIVVAIISLKDKVKFIGDIFDAFGKIIGVVIQALKDFLDWIGLTNFEEQELAEQRTARADQHLKELSAIAKAQQGEYDRAIALAKAEGKNTTALEDEKQKAIQRTANATAKALVEKFNALKAEEKLTKEVADEINAKIVEQNEIILNSINQRKINRINEANEAKKLEEENTAWIEEQEKKRADAYKKYRKERLDAERMIQDLELQLMEEGTEKELASLNLKYDRMIADTMSNETMLREEKEKVIKYYESLRALEEGKILSKENAKAEAKAEADRKFLEAAQEAQLQLIEGFQEEAYQLLLTDQEREEEALRTKYENQLQLARDYGQSTFEIEAAYAKQKADMEDRYRKEKLAKDQAVEDAKLQLASDGLNTVSQLAELFGKKNEKAAKRAFAVQKAVSIAQAVMDTYKGANAIFASAAANPSSVLFPAQPFIAAGIAITSGLANVAKIASSRFEGGSAGGGSAPSAPSFGGGGSTSSASSTPSFELFGQPNEDNNVSAPQSQETTQMTVKAVVVESDITSTQNKIEKMQKNAEL